MNIINETKFQKDSPLKAAKLVTLTNKNGLQAQFSNYGARWVSMLVPDKFGKFENVVLGFDTLSGYQKAREKYHGAIVGRVCGRINNASFSLNGKIYNLAENDVYGQPKRNHLHGGIRTFHNSFWQIKQQSNNLDSVTFSLFSPDGEEGYPGNLSVEVSYTLTDQNSILIEYYVTTDCLTPVNLTNHAFFNLGKDQHIKTILSHSLTLSSSHIVECNSELIPTGKLINVANTPFDFRNSKIISKSIEVGDKNVKDNNGFSTTFVLDKKDKTFAIIAILEDQESGRKMKILTDQPCLQVYTGYFMDGNDIGEGNHPYYANAGIALEALAFPDAVNQFGFPSILIDENCPYYHRTEYCF